jgi:hypothetical protein
LVSTSACHAEGRGFESRRPRQHAKAPGSKGRVLFSWAACFVSRRKSSRLKSGSSPQYYQALRRNRRVLFYIEGHPECITYIFCAACRTAAITSVQPRMLLHALPGITVADLDIQAREAPGSCSTRNTMRPGHLLCSVKNRSRDGKTKNILTL